MKLTEKKKKYNSIISNLNDGLAGMIGRNRTDIKDYDKKINPVSGSAPPPCGSMQRNPAPGTDKNNAEAKRRRRKAQDAVESIIEEMAQNKIKFPDASDMLPPKKSSPGKGQGSLSGMVDVPALMGKPTWFNEIESGIGEMIGKPERGRKGIDYESAQTYIEQGVMITRRPRAKISKPNKEVYVLMDQSGSMQGHAYKGYNYLELLGAFVPALAEVYEGWFWVCDDCNLDNYEQDPTSVPNAAVKLENVTGSIIMKGGGGTSFDGAFAKLGDIERRKKEEIGDKYEMCVLFFSDMFIGDYEFERYRDMGPSKIMFITGGGESEEQLKPHKWIWGSDKHKIVIVDLETEKAK